MVLLGVPGLDDVLNEGELLGLSGLVGVPLFGLVTRSEELISIGTGFGLDLLRGSLGSGLAVSTNIEGISATFLLVTLVDGCLLPLISNALCLRFSFSLICFFSAA